MPRKIKNVTIRYDPDDGHWEAECYDGYRFSDLLEPGAEPGNRRHYWHEDTRQELEDKIRGQIVPE